MENLDYDVKKFGHDINNSLTRVILNLRKTLKEDDIKIIYERIESTIDIALECAEFCKSIMMGTNEVDVFSDTFFKDYIKESSNEFQNLKIQFQSKKNIKITVDIHLLKNAILNIIKNSLEANSTQLLIEVSETEIKFIDNGKGITKSDEKLIKEKGTIKEDKSGHGLGLLSVSSFCKQNGWSMIIKNNTKFDAFPTGFTVTFNLNPQKS